MKRYIPRRSGSSSAATALIAGSGAAGLVVALLITNHDNAYVAAGMRLSCDESGVALDRFTG
jgi:hypothetical protein